MANSSSNSEQKCNLQYSRVLSPAIQKVHFSLTPCAMQCTQHDHRVHLCALSPSALVRGGTSVQLGNDHDDSDDKDYKDDMDDKDY